MSTSKSDIFNFGMRFGLDVSDAENAHDIGKALGGAWTYPEGVQSRASEITENQDLVSAVLQAKRIILEEIE